MEEDIGPLMQERLKKIEELRKQGINPYPYRYAPTHRAIELHEKYTALKAHEETQDQVKVAGRIKTIRRMGKACFVTIEDATGKIQGFLKEDFLGDRDYELFKLADLGDFIGIEGRVMKTKTGELSVLADRFEILAKGIRPLPEKFHGLKDPEIRYRKRYLDFIMNPEVKERFKKRARIISMMRSYLEGKGFIEFETPVLQPIYGGANAKPFKTHHNVLDMPLYLKISPELYLKRLIVGGFDKVYEIGKNFRNEGIDYSHNPEFSMLELYQAYADYNDMMDLTEEMVKMLCERVAGTFRFKYRGFDIDMSQKWERVTMANAIHKHAGINMDNLTDSDVLSLVEKHGLEIKGKPNRGIVTNALFEKLVQEKLIQPTFITDYPREVCPLTKVHRHSHSLTERFELYIAGQEWANAYSELNDPVDQRKRLEEQDRLRLVDDEAQPMDEDFVEAIEYCMPPTGGLGLGVDRLVMLLTGTDSIKEVIAFPTMKLKQ